MFRAIVMQIMVLKAAEEDTRAAMQTWIRPHVELCDRGGGSWEARQRTTSEETKMKRALRLRLGLWSRRHPRVVHDAAGLTRVEAAELRAFLAARRDQ